MNRIKSFLSSAITGLLLFSFCSSYSDNMDYQSVKAGQQLGQTDFDYGVGFPWHISTSETGEMDFKLIDGKYQITIVNPGGASKGGEDRWDCQFRHRGLKIVAGHQYEISYEITANKSGQYYTKIGNLDGDVEIWHSNTNESDFGANWGMIQLAANQTNKVKMTFTTNQSLDVAEWVFHLGGDGPYTQGGCFPAGTVITFDNMSLIDITSDENDFVYEDNNDDYLHEDGNNVEGDKETVIYINQLGYFPNGEKKATLCSDSPNTVSYEVYNSEDQIVYTGLSELIGYDEDSGNDVHMIDFSEFDEVGDNYYIVVSGNKSHTFSIKNNLYSSMLYDSLNYFYQNRSGIPIESQYISSGDAYALSRPAGHYPDMCVTESCWGYSDFYTLDVTGGWYDAGDYGKSVVNGGVSLWTLQNQYERALFTTNDNQVLYGDGVLNIPESGNGIPDILDESRVELEWMIKMMVPTGYKYEGMVHHKVYNNKRTGLAYSPSYDSSYRTLMPPTTAATLNLAACAAQASRLWKYFDKSFAEECLESAKKAYDAAKKNPSMFAPSDGSVGEGEYGDDNVDDEFYWAACELYLATGDKEYYKDLNSYDNKYTINTVLKSGENKGVTGSYDWGNVSALGTMSLATVKGGISEKELNSIKNSFEEASNYYLDIEKKQGYGVPLKSTEVMARDSETVIGYPWGSNSIILNTAMIMAYAYDLTGNTEYLDGARLALDYIMGRNPLDNCYVTGYGENHSKNPYHRWWSNQIDDRFPSAPNGVLVCGPNSGLQDMWVKGLGMNPGEIPPQLCYVDYIEAWSTNECSINCNAPLAWMTGFFTDEPIREALSLKLEENFDLEGTSKLTNPNSDNVDIDFEKYIPTIFTLLCICFIYKLIKRLTYKSRVRKSIKKFVIDASKNNSSDRILTESCLFAQPEVNKLLNEREKIGEQTSYNFMKECLRENIIREMKVHFEQILFVDKDKTTVNYRVFLPVEFYPYYMYLEEKNIDLLKTINEFNIINQKFIQLCDDKGEVVAVFVGDIIMPMISQLKHFIKNNSKLSDVPFVLIYLLATVYNNNVLAYYLPLGNENAKDEGKEFYECFVKLAIKQFIDDGEMRILPNCDNAQQMYIWNREDKNGIVPQESGYENEQSRSEVDVDANNENLDDCPP